MFIGEGPGRQEDLQGLPFVGPAGQLFDKMLAAIDLDRSQVYICNVVKCRPPQNRDPEDDEKAACLPLLRAQVALVKPKIIVCLGRIAGQVVLKPNFRITREHGIWEERKGYHLSATYHPSALLRDPAKKRDSWEDMKKLRQKIIDLGILPGYGEQSEVAAGQGAEQDEKNKAAEEIHEPQESQEISEEVSEIDESLPPEPTEFAESSESAETAEEWQFDDIDFAVDAEIGGSIADDDGADPDVFGF